MATLAIHCLATWFLWYVVSQSDLPVWAQLREIILGGSPKLEAFVMCPVCCGFWCSLTLAGTSALVFTATLYSVILLAMAGAAFTYAFERIINRP